MRSAGSHELSIKIGRDPGTNARVLGLDPGSKCGYAAGETEAGVWKLTAGKDRPGCRFVRFRDHLSAILDEGFGLVAYEDVKAHKGSAAAHVYGGLIAILTEECERRGIPYTPTPVCAIKKFATGHGHATKEQMVDAAQRRWGAVFDDNEADARWIREYAIFRLEKQEDINIFLPPVYEEPPGKIAA